MALTPLEQCASLGAKLRCLILDNPGWSPEIKRRLAMAAAILETGCTPNPFDLLGAVPMKEVKRRYIEYMVVRAGGMVAAARAMGIDPTTIWRQGKTEKPPSGGSLQGVQIVPLPVSDRRMTSSPGARGPGSFSGRHAKSQSNKK